MQSSRFIAGLLATAVIAACSSSDDGGTSNGGATGSVQIFVVPEDTISKGLDPGTELENVQDGWTIRYDRYLVTVGNFRAKRTDTGASIGEPSIFVLDLKNAPENGYVVADLKDIAAVRWDKFGFDVANAKAGAKTLAPTAQADVDFMIQNGYSVYYEGFAEKGPDKITFKWGFVAGTSFDDCATEDGLAGFAVPAGGTVQVKPTIHGDHEYFDNVTQGVEITKRLAEWIKTCDADTNRELTIDELKKCDVAKAMPSPPYDLSAVKDQDGDGKITVYDYVNTQMRTFGDYQGDGECPTRAPLP
jgi:hypothetical protein